MFLLYNNYYPGEMLLIQVLIVDDHAIVRTGLKRILEKSKDIKVIGETDDGEKAVQIVKEKKPNVVLMDIHMPGIGGLEATRRIMHYEPQTRILVLTVSDDDVFPTRFLKNGAAGYITKGSDPEQLAHAIREVVHNNQRYLSPDIAQQLALKRVDDKKSIFQQLSERELQVLMMLTRGEKTPDIANQLNLSTKTVNTYRYRMFAKLGVKSDVELAHLAIRHGVIDKPISTNDDKE